MAEIVTSASCTVVVVLSLSESKSLVDALRFCEVDGDLPENLERVLRKLHEYINEVHGYYGG